MRIALPVVEIAKEIDVLRLRGPFTIDPSFSLSVVMKTVKEISVGKIAQTAPVRFDLFKGVLKRA